jgi:hypothetical protein
MLANTESARRSSLVEAILSAEDAAAAVILELEVD